jgi:hypothetical protein
MIIYARNSDDVIVGLADEETTCPADCREISVDAFPKLWTTEGYKYVDGNITPTAKGQAYIDQFLEKKKDCLWRAAKSYQEDQLDANGLIGMQFKAQAGGVKAQANVDWVQDIWDEYYTRKAAIEADPDADISLDFSALGDLPHGYYEAAGEGAE